MSSTDWISKDSLEFLKDHQKERNRFSSRFGYYHQDTLLYFNRMLAPESRVLIVGCDVGRFAAKLKCRTVYTWELNPYTPIATSDNPNIQPHSALSESKETVDYLLLPYTLQFVSDIQSFLMELQPLISQDTRIVILQYNFIWSPLIKIAERIGLKTPSPDLNWLNAKDVHNLLKLSLYETVAFESRCLIPIYIPGFSYFLNNFLSFLPIVRFFFTEDIYCSALYC